MAPNSTSRIAAASFVGTAIEFYDFYIYGMAAALVIGPVFFPQSDAAAQALNAFLTFGLAFLARPLGAALFGHFGDRVGRKATLVASLLVMGISTMLIGLLPGYDAIGWLAPALLCLLRFGQGIGLGGEWGGAALLATENAPAGKRGWFGMFPQLGPPAGFLLATGSFLLLAHYLSEAEFKTWGWRIPFIASALLVAVGLYVRLKLTETPVFARSLQATQPARLPLAMLLSRHAKPLILGAMAMAVCYALFYITTVFSLSYGTSTLHIPRQQFLGMLCIAVLFMAAATPLAAWAGDRYGRRPVLLAAGCLALFSGFLLAPALNSGSSLQITAFLSLELFLMGATFAPMGALLPELFPTQVRYTGAGTAYNLGGILRASFAPYIAQKLVNAGGLAWVGGYVSVAAAISLLAVFACVKRGITPCNHELATAIFLMGPTASGKTGLAVELVQRLPLEIISVDSALVYRDMDTGTAKPDAATLAKAPHHLIDLISPTEAYSAAQFREDALKLMGEITKRGKVPLLVGGTMLYFNALQHGLNDLPEADPQLRAELDARAEREGWPAMHRELAAIDPVTAERLQPNDAQRIERALEIWHLTGKPMSALLAEQNTEVLPYKLLKVALLPSNRVVLHQRIAERFDAMLAGGLLDEVKALKVKYPALHPAQPSMRCVGYRQALEHLEGQYNLVTLREKGIAATRQLAKRQMTWLRGMDDVEELDCLESGLAEALEQRIRAFIGRQ